MVENPNESSIGRDSNTGDTITESELEIDTISAIEGSDSNASRDGFLALSGIFVIAELLILGQFGEYGLFIHGVGLLALFLLIYRTDGVTGWLYQSMVLIPVLRIFNFGIPMFTENSLLVLGIIYTFLLLSVIQIIRSQGLTVDVIGLSVRKIPFGALGLGLGLILGFIQFGLALEGLDYTRTLQNYILVVLTTGVLIGLVEELIFRGLIQRWAATLFHHWIAIIVTSVIFGFMHSIWLNPADIVFAFAVSVFLGWLYLRWNNMWFIAGLHGMINVSAFLIYPLVVPSAYGELPDIILASIF